MHKDTDKQFIVLTNQQKANVIGGSVPKPSLNQFLKTPERVWYYVDGHGQGAAGAPEGYTPKDATKL